MLGREGADEGALTRFQRDEPIGGQTPQCFAHWHTADREVIGQVILEYSVLTAYGASVGGVVGLITAEIFAPFFRIPDNAGAPPPPLLPLIEQEATVQLALVFVALMILAEVGVLVHALSVRLFDTLRMGHQG